MIHDETTNHKLTRIYVALAMTREVAERGVINKENTQSMVTLVNVASKILEELLDDGPHTVEPEIPEIEMLM